MPNLAPYPQAVTLNSSGAGTARIQNNNVTVQWVVRMMTTRTVPQQAGCYADVFQGVNFIGRSYFAGSGDTASGDPPLYLDPGEYVEAQFVGGPASGQGIFTVYYEEIPRGWF